MTALDLSTIRTDGGTQPRAAIAGTVYAMRRGGSDGPIKFGFTAGDVFARAAQLQTGAAEPIIPVSWTPALQQEERALHAHFADFRMTGEWFFPTRRVLKAAANLEVFIRVLRRTSGFFSDVPAALDVGDREVKLTRDLTQLEVRRIIAIRKDSIDADIRSLTEIEAAYDAAQPVWADRPEWLFGQALDAAVKKMADGKWLSA